MYWDKENQAHLWPIIESPPEDSKKVKEFEAFHESNPKIWDEFQARTLEAIRKGKKKIGARLIFESIRWDKEILANREDGFKMNNNLHPYYARKFLKSYPDHREIFELRKVR